MQQARTITILVFMIAAVAALATLTGILSAGGPGPFAYTTIRGQQVTIYGRGLYRDMSADVAVQGIAQDYVTLFAGIPLLLVALFAARAGSLRGLFLLSGALGYFLLTYLFYTAMGMYNALFLAYVFLLGASFFAFILTLFSYRVDTLKETFRSERLPRVAGLFLIVNAALIALLWFSVVVPPLLNGTIIPPQVLHYTTLIVQGFDLGLFLPMAIVSGWLALQKNSYGYLFTPVYIVFLSLLMTALSAKIAFMAAAGVNVVPAVFIIPAFTAISVVFAVLLLKNVRQTSAYA
jgi:hypothetical protein